MTFDDLPTNKAIELYYEKHHALRHGDLIKLIELKNNYPIMFTKETDERIRRMIAHAKKVQGSQQYKDMIRKNLKDKLTVITNDLLVE